MSGRRVVTGTVKSDKTLKTRTVVVEQFFVDGRFGKRLKRQTKCYVHDEFNASRLGDLVEIVECRPRSRLKRWELVRIVRRSGDKADLERRAHVASVGGACEAIIDWLEAEYLRPAEKPVADVELRSVWESRLRANVYRDPRSAQVFQAFLCDPDPNRRRDLVACLFDAVERSGLWRALSERRGSGEVRRPARQTGALGSRLPLAVRVEPPSQSRIRLGAESVWRLDVLSTPTPPRRPELRRDCLEFTVEQRTARTWPATLLVPFGISRPQRRDFMLVPQVPGKLELRVDCRYAGHIVAYVEQTIEVAES
ncbi:MAG: 30S ribosomal protein S17 [Planctomycetes bacterium]|nr:30S ribosomal protein S17 [Planctomycetota bacterium]